MTAYQIHDNGGRPWTVVVGDIDYTGDDQIINPNHVRVLNDENVVLDATCHSVHPGAAVLLQTTERLNYVYVGPEIYSFATNEPILEFVPRIGNSDVVYAYAKTQNWIYLLLEKKRIPRDASYEGFDPYSVLWQQNDWKGSAPVTEDVPCIQLRARPRFERYEIALTPLMSLERCATLMARDPATVCADEIIMQMRKVMPIMPPLLSKTIQIISLISYVVRWGNDDARVPEFVWQILCHPQLTYLDAPDPIPPERVMSCELASIRDCIEPDYRAFIDWVLAHQGEFKLREYDQTSGI